MLKHAAALFPHRQHCTLHATAVPHCGCCTCTTAIAGKYTSSGLCSPASAAGELSHRTLPCDQLLWHTVRASAAGCRAVSPRALRDARQHTHRRCDCWHITRHNMYVCRLRAQALQLVRRERQVEAALLGCSGAAPHRGRGRARATVEGSRRSWTRGWAGRAARRRAVHWVRGHADAEEAHPEPEDHD